MKRWNSLFAVIIIILSFSPFLYAATQTRDVEFINCISWNFQDKPTPQTYWSPYLPMPTQQVFRMKMGFRFSTGTIALKNSVKVNFSWDDTQAVAFKTLQLKIKPSFKDENFNVFESAFGLYLPNAIEIGFVGISGVPDVLPWFELPYDFWDLVGFIPKVGSYIASAQDQIGVNMSSKNKLPLGGQAEYHDTRDLISLSVADLLSDQKKEQLATKIFDKVPSSSKTALLAAIKAAKKVNDAGAEKFAKDLIGKGLEKLGSMASITIKGDPYYTIKGHSLVVLVKYWIPGKMSGNYPITFTKPDEDFTLNIKLPAFIKEGDQLHVTVESITYNFTLEQNLNFKIAFGTIPLVSSPQWDVINSHKVVTYSQAKKVLSTSDCLLQIPIAKSTEKILDYKVKTGVTTATVWWASPDVMLKGTVKVYKGTQLVAQKTEPTFTTSHQVQFAGLEKNTTYRFVTSCVDSQGSVSPEMSIEAATKDKSSFYFTNNTQVQYDFGTFQMNLPTVVADTNTITFTWPTNAPSSTEVFLGLASDFSDNYVGYVKKGTRNPDGSYTNISIAKGYYDSNDKPGDRVFETNHSITVPGLEPGTLYYYRVASWLFYDPNKRVIVTEPTGTPLYVLEYVGTVTTKQAPLLNVQCIKASNNQPAKNLEVIVAQGQTSQVYVSDSNGYLPQVVLEKGKTYTVSVVNHPYFADRSLSITVPAQQDGLMQKNELFLAYKNIPGGYVYDSRGNPLQGVIITATKGTQTKTATTDTKGFYAFDGDWLGQGSFTLSAQKEGYSSVKIQAEVDAGGIFTAKPAILKSTSIEFNIIAKNYKGNVLPNANVTIKEGNTIKATTKTNQQGIARITLPGYTDSNEHTFTVEVVSTQMDSLQVPDYMPFVVTVTSFADDVNVINAICQANTTPPSVLASSIARVANTFELNCQLNMTAEYSITHTRPDGSVTTSPIANTVLNENNKPIIKKTYDMSGQPYGVHTFTIYAKDKYKTKLHEIITLEKEWKYIDIATSPTVYPSLQTTNNSIIFKWKAWYKESEFGKYVLILENPSKTIEIPSFETTTYTLTGLTPGTLYCGTYKVYDKNGNVLFAMQNPSQFCVRTSSQPPVISNVQITPNPAGTNQEIRLQASVNDPDTTIGKVTVTLQKIEEVKDGKGNVIDKKILSSTVVYENSNFTGKSATINTRYTVNEPGTYTVLLRAQSVDPNEFAESSHTVSILKELDISAPKISLSVPVQVSLKEVRALGYALHITIISIDAEAVDMKASVDWGDGNKELVEIKPDMLSKTTTGKEGSADYQNIYTGKVSLPLQYQKAGKYVITVFVEANAKGKLLQSVPARAEVEVIE
ncbi:MAG: carboxypeptidase regulatory-like domain-containing protein [Spirochaetes bacterium]|nr:carboxypeptidase regulatory-like domain-containing protein [Spirochaetota bacterium]